MQKDRFRIIFYIVLVLLLVAVFIVLDQLIWRNGRLAQVEPTSERYLLHTVMEVAATATALFTGAVALVRYYTRPRNMILLLGAGFAGAALLDGFHGFVTCLPISRHFPSIGSSLLPWSWNASRTFLAIVMFLSWIAWRREQKYGDAARLSDIAIYSTVGALTAATFLFFAFVPLGPAYFSGIFGRPQEFVPAVFFGIALCGYLSKQEWRTDPLEHWAVASLIVALCCQALFMSRSYMLFDGMFVVSHSLKIVSYVLVLVGLLTDIHATWIRELGLTAELKEANISLETRFQEAQAARRRAEEAEHQLEEVASQMAMPPRSQMHAGQKFSIQNLTLNGMMLCGGAIRGMSRQHSTFAKFTSAVARYLYESFCSEDGSSEFALLRIFHTQRYADMTEAQQRIATETHPDISPGTICVTLVGTAGDQPAWNQIASSKGHQVIPVSSADAVQQMPMFAQLQNQLGLSIHPDANLSSSILIDNQTTGVFHVEKALGSPFVPAQDFVSEYGIRSVVGFGDSLPDGAMFVAIGFAKVDIDRNAAQLFSHLSHSTLVGLAPFLKVEAKTVAQIHAFDRLLMNHEFIVAQQETRLREAFDKLAHSNEALEQSNVELKQFAYVASHDLQTPLRSVAGFADMLKATYGGELDAKADKHIARIVNGCKRMQTLINDLLSYSRVESRSLPFELTALNDVFADAVAVLDASLTDSGGSITRAELPVVRGDAAQLSQLLQNLIGNGLKYHGDEPPRIHVDACRNGASWQISVRDHGIGIAPEQHDRIFELFRRLHTQSEYPGTGIGLAICRRIVLRHGGRIWLESGGESGSVFYFTIPQPGDEPGAPDVNGMAAGPVSPETGA